MTSRTPRRHRRLALMAAGTAAAMVLLPGAASAQVLHSAQRITGIPGGPAVPPTNPVGPNPGRATPSFPVAPTGPVITIPGKGTLDEPNHGGLLDGLLGGDRDRDGHHDGDRHHDGDGHHDGDVQRDDTPDSDHLRDPRPPDHASGAVADINLLRSRLLEITKNDATIEDDGKAHSDSTVLGLGGSRIIGSRSSSDDRYGDDRHERDHHDGALCLGGTLCLSLLYHDTIAKQDHDSSLAAARGGLAALCLGDRDRDRDRDRDITPSYQCDGILSLGVAEGRAVAKRDQGETTADSANELLNLCLGRREKLTTPCEGLGLRAVHSDSESRSDKPDTDRHSFVLGIDSNGRSSYLLDDPFALALPRDCGDSALLCLFLNQGKSVIFHNPKGAGSVQEALRLDVLNRALLVVLGQSETLAHETNENEGHGHGNGEEHGNGEGNHGEAHGNGENNGNGPELAQTGADIAPLLAGGFLLTGLGALTVAATRRRAGKHTL